MPLLSDEDLRTMRAKPQVTCGGCVKPIRQNYCRQCDEFFEDGHNADCPEILDDSEHKGHRTY